MTVDRLFRRAMGRTALVVVTVLLVTAALAAFPACSPAGPAVVARVLSYNVHNLFDDVDDGREYAAFRSEAGWGRDDYYRRLARLDEAIRLVTEGRRLDVVAFQEVESSKVAADFARDFLRGFRYISAGPSGVSNTKVVVLSRRRPAAVRAHRVVELRIVPGRSDSLPPAFARRPGRDAVDVTLFSPDLRIISVHWKSQVGGEARTEPQRKLEAALIHDVLLDRTDDAAAQDDAQAVLLIGDMNADVEQYRRHGRSFPTAIKRIEDVAEAQAAFGPLRPGIRYLGANGDPAVVPGRDHDPSSGGELVFRSLWDGVEEPGTYRFRGEWSRLDQAYLHAPEWISGTLEVGAHPTLTARDGAPFGFSPRTGAGYSDHYSILVTLTRDQGR